MYAAVLLRAERGQKCRLRLRHEGKDGIEREEVGAQAWEGRVGVMVGRGGESVEGLLGRLWRSYEGGGLFLL